MVEITTSARSLFLTFSVLPNIARVVNAASLKDTHCVCRSWGPI